MFQIIMALICLYIFLQIAGFIIGIFWSLWAISGPKQDEDEKDSYISCEYDDDEDDNEDDDEDDDDNEYMY